MKLSDIKNLESIHVEKIYNLNGNFTYRATILIIDDEEMRTGRTFTASGNNLTYAFEQVVKLAIDYQVV